MPAFDYDLFVIGAGSGGVRAARMAAKAGVRVAVAEDRYLGGTCVNVGCVPKKLFVYGSHYSEDFHDAAAFGWRTPSTPEFDWATLRDNKTREIERLNGIYRDLLQQSGVTLINGRASLSGPQSVMVEGKHYTAERILIATGGWPHVPEFPGSEHVITSNEVFSLEQFPNKVIVVGGGYIAVEFAGIFQGLGADTQLLYRRDLFLRGFDHEVRQFVANELERKGIRLRFNTNIAAIEQLGSGELLATLMDGSQVSADAIFYATGRQANTEGLGLEQVGIETNAAGQIAVNKQFQTNIPSIYALGDVVGRMELTPVALAEGMALVRHLYSGGDIDMNYDTIPTAVFCQPNIATVGLTEEQARERYDNIDVYQSDFRPLKHTLGDNMERFMMKLVVDADTDKVIGAHMVGAEAGEIIQGVAIAMKAGATKAHFDQTIGIHPTSAEEFVTLREARA